MPPRATQTERFICTILDKFLIEEQKPPSNSPNGEFAVRDYVRSIQRDLMDLLNTRQSVAEERLVSLEQARTSIVTYGFPEVNSVTYVSQNAQRQLAVALESAIRQFEPRLLSVRVHPVESQVGEVRFRVEALARMEPRPQRIVFDTTVDLERQECRIETD